MIFQKYKKYPVWIYEVRIGQRELIYFTNIYIKVNVNM